jgi:hypothetical protein
MRYHHPAHSAFTHMLTLAHLFALALTFTLVAGAILFMKVPARCQHQRRRDQSDVSPHVICLQGFRQK